jgi:hypothetical protein
MMKRISNFWYKNLGTVICFSIPVTSLIVMLLVWIATDHNKELAGVWGIIALGIMCILALAAHTVLAIKVFTPEMKLRKQEADDAYFELHFTYKDGAGI